MTQELDEVVAFMQKFRALGYAVVVFEPDELRGVNPERVEEAMIAEGNDLVDFSAEEDEECEC
jgi:hypothetical protein